MPYKLEYRRCGLELRRSLARDAYICPRCSEDRYNRELNLLKELSNYLAQIKQLKGVENVILSRKSEEPIQSAEVFFHEDEMFNISSATGKVFYFGRKLYPQKLNSILIEGEKAIFLILPLIFHVNYSLDEFFITITCQPNTNLMNKYQTDESVKQIKKLIKASKELFKRPSLQRDRVFLINDKESSSSVNLTKSISIELKRILEEISYKIPDVKLAYILLEGGL